ncbi:MAG TPA: HAS-barrel domain-containing protein [Thermodesulfobacteriota bacterium]|nr:HAS-barrel domain-containing protein [Thermodesulfobacteriota bacterium]
MMANHVGEVIESSTRGFVARSQNVGESPHFGYFVKTKGEPVVYGVVYEILTESKEPGRKPTTYGMSIEELRREQPQIFELLKTEFHALIIAYSEQGKTRFSLPPLPPPIYSFVYECEKEEIERLTSQDFFLRSIISSPNIPVDDLIIASLRYAQDSREFDKDYIVRMGKSLARIFKDDYERLSSVLRRII